MKSSDFGQKFQNNSLCELHQIFILCQVAKLCPEEINVCSSSLIIFGGIFFAIL
jgi:hypothetical protein